MEEYPDIASIHMVENRLIDHMIIQYKETNWQFLKRLATHFNTVLIADSMGDYRRFWIGIHKTPKQLEDILDYTTINDIKQYRFVAEHGFDVSEWDFMKHSFWSNTRLSLGDCVMFQGKSYIVEHAKVGFVNGLFRYFYVIGRERGLIQLLQRNERLSGVSLLGKVIDTKDSYVKIHLNIDESQDVETANWIPFASEGNNVFYCMPEIGQDISLYFSNSNEADAIAINAVRSNGNSCTTMVEPLQKRFAVPTGQEIRLGERDFDIVNHNYMYINLCDDEGIHCHCIDDISICSGGNIKFEAEKYIYCAVFDNHDEIEEEGKFIVAIHQGSQIYFKPLEGSVNVYSPDTIMVVGELRTSLESLNEEIPVEDVPSRPLWQRVLMVAATIAVAAVVTILVVKTGGAALAFVAKIAKAKSKKAAVKKLTAKNTQQALIVLEFFNILSFSAISISSSATL